MAYAKIKKPKLADVIEDRIEAMILEGTLAVGEKLPPERSLAEQFDVSRPSLREAIQRLESKGLLMRRQGGGTYVQAHLHKKLADPLFELLNSNPRSQYDLLEFRYAIEGVSAYFSALRGNVDDLSKIKTCFDAIESAQKNNDLELEIQQITLFHMAVIEASHNVVFLHLARSIKPLLEKNIADNIKQLYRVPEVANKIHQHRVQLLEAILSKLPLVAQNASAQHLIYIEETRSLMLDEKSIFKCELGSLHLDKK
ncbi:transcriptional regulator [Psychromonas sp. CNPT3]|uniref:pyruvate dehydrogenase complex transcriptional repressor PdhR n=1 Tax=Psychromonas sp. CNPT3 TaxID=314282 RepID=UPI00006E34A9|nr:pyruvate dehydrogenase complex transcriptional repressor PdhR [Psychromonas sp. CNPT3]AGH80582.1 transcriptional regulator [Psychromonas sp. CNPT3]